MAFLFENLLVYQKSLAFAHDVDRLRRDRERNIHRILADQFFRASLSIPLNIAEGNGRWHKGDKRNFFWIARGSAFECVPLLGLLRLNGAISEQEYLALYGRLEELSKMITALVQHFEEKIKL